MRGEYKVSGILMSLVVMAALSFGLFQFFSGTATTYVAPQVAALQGNLTYFNQANYVNDRIGQAWTSLQQLSLYNPVTWLNIFPTMVNVFAVLTGLPGLIQGMVLYSAQIAGLPVEAAYFAEIAVLIIVVVAAISAINHWEI